MTKAALFDIISGESNVEIEGGNNYENSAEFKAEAEKVGRILGIIMMIATICFMLVGFLGDAWAPAWLVFPIGGMLCGIVAMVMHKRR